MELYLIIVVILFVLAISDLVVGVSNDAVNFLNSAIGSKVAPRYIIMIVASVGILVGTTFSSGLMEVARKGIFNPEHFYFPEIMTIFLAVMLTDVVLLDLYNTFALPTSTTVSIVFELLGAAVAISLIKMAEQSGGDLLTYINTGKALAIISGILISVVVAFTAGALIQFISRLIFTFDYEKKFKRYGALWGAAALTFIIYFILVKGTKGASFLTEESSAWIKANVMTIVAISFILWTIIFQIIILATKMNVLKFIVLSGTFALALAFAANDLVNFIGVPLAGLSSYLTAMKSADPLDLLMEALRQPVQTRTYILLGAGIIMVVTLWYSKKARSVTKTEVNLGRQQEGAERFESSLLARKIVRMSMNAGDMVKKVMPASAQAYMDKRFAPAKPPKMHGDERPAFDLIRASVNLMVSSILISFATSLKLPLSTTYVTFMVAMGSSFSDRAWGRDSAVYRVNGVLTVIGGWFFTAFMAFTVAGVYAVIIFYGDIYAVILLTGVAAFFVYKTHYIHGAREKEEEEKEKRLLTVSENGYDAVKAIMHDTQGYMTEISEIVKTTIAGLDAEDRQQLKDARKAAKKLHKRSNMLVSDIFNSLKVFKLQEVKKGNRFGKLMSSIQGCANNLRNITAKCYEHIDNNHRRPADVHIDELYKLNELLREQIEESINIFHDKKFERVDNLNEKIDNLQEAIDKFDENQVSRIKDGKDSTRDSLLFLGILSDIEKISDHLGSLVNLTRKSYEGFTKEKAK